MTASSIDITSSQPVYNLSMIADVLKCCNISPFVPTVCWQVESNSSPNCDDSFSECKPGFLRDPTALPPRRPPWPYMANLAVVQQARRRGIGNMLVAEVEKIVVDWGFRELLLKVETSNVVAMEFYLSLGYEEVYRREGQKLVGDSLFGRTEAVELSYYQRLLTVTSSRR
eukprot:5043654-Pyramimonas_sp.AAC.2